MKENEEVELKCTVGDARPKAGVVWYRGTERFNPGEVLFLRPTGHVMLLLLLLGWNNFYTWVSTEPMYDLVIFCLGKLCFLAF